MWKSLKRWPVVFVAHGGSVIIACCLLVDLYMSRPITHPDSKLAVSMAFMGLFAGVGAVTGLWLMARRQGKSESLLLAASTVIAVFLSLLGLC
jgi:hypothetical protein